MVETEVLSKLPLFTSLDEAGLEQVAAWFELRDVSEGVELAGQGASGYNFFVLCDGRAEVTTSDATLATLGPGDFFGEGAMVGGGRRNASVVTTAPSQVLVMFGTEFRRLQQLHPEVAARIEAVARERGESVVGD
jgi:CRP-like cAMP-binding protein